MMTGGVEVNERDWKGFLRTQGPSWADPVSGQPLWVLIEYRICRDALDVAVRRRARGIVLDPTVSEQTWGNGRTLRWRTCKARSCRLLSAVGSSFVSSLRAPGSP